MRETCALFTFVIPKTKKEKQIAEIKISKARVNQKPIKNQMPWLLMNEQDKQNVKK